MSRPSPIGIGGPIWREELLPHRGRPGTPSGSSATRTRSPSLSPISEQRGVEQSVQDGELRSLTPSGQTLVEDERLQDDVGSDFERRDGMTTTEALGWRDRVGMWLMRLFCGRQS